MTIRRAVFAGTVLLAVAMRVANLGYVPLADDEAVEALWAAEGTPADSAFWPMQEGSASSAFSRTATRLAFELTGAGEATARLPSAVVGSLVVIVPWLLRRRLGTAAAATSSLLLAVSPTLVATSRLAGGTSAALTAIPLAAAGVVLVLDGEWPPPRATAALAMAFAVAFAAGPHFFTGAMIVLLATRLAVAIGHRAWPEAQVAVLRSVFHRAAGLGVAGSVALAFGVGVLPDGGMVLAEGLRQWLLGWIGPGAVHPLTPVATLVVYEPLSLVFGIIGAVAAWRSRDLLGAGAAAWAALGVLFAVAYSGRSGVFVAWSAVPLAILAGRALAGEIERFRALAAPWQAASVAALLTLLVAYAGLQVSGYATGIGPGSNPLIPAARLVVAFGAVVVGIVASLLIGMGWGWEITRGGVAAAAGVVLLLLTIHAGWRLNFFRERIGASELWRPTAPTVGIPRLASTLQSLSMTARGVRGDLPLVLDHDRAPASIVWALRAFPRFAPDDSDPFEGSPIVLAPVSNAAPALAEDYLGQTIIVAETWDFAGALPPDFLGWWFRRRIPVREEAWLLLVRADVATLGEATPDADEP